MLRGPFGQSLYSQIPFAGVCACHPRDGILDHGRALRCYGRGFVMPLIGAGVLILVLAAVKAQGIAAVYCQAQQAV